MKLFSRRPLAAACALFIFSLLAAYFVPLSVAFFGSLFAGALALVCLILCLLRGFSYRRLLFFLVLLGVCLGCLRVSCEKSIAQKSWNGVYGETAEVEFTVKDILFTNAYGGELLVEVRTINGITVNSRAVLRGEQLLPFYTKDRIQAALTVHSLDYEAFSENSKYSYYAQGATALLVLEDTSSVTLLESGTNTLKTRLVDLRARLSHRISRTVSGEKGNLLAAMLLGSKNLLSDQTLRDFRLAGVSHLLALSGLHLVILAGLLERLLYLLGAGKRLRIAILLPLCVFYLMLTGCNYSLLRAMIMLGFVYASALFREDHDSLTALLLTASAILLFSPFALFSISFQMTVLATFGILAFIKMQTLLSTLFPKGNRRATRILWRFVRFLCSSLLLSISTTVTLLAVLWLEIGYYSLMTPLSNLLLIPLAPLLLLSALTVMLVPFSFVGSIAGVPATFVLALTQRLAAPQAIISLEPAYIPFIVVPVILVTFVFLIIDLKRLYPLTLAPAVLCMLAFVLIFCIFADMDKGLSVIYRQSGKNEGLILVRGSQAMICDISNTSTTQLRADWREAQRAGATELSVLLFSHYHNKSAMAFSRLTQSVLVKEIWLPAPLDEAERDILSELLAVALERGVRVSLYDPQTPLTVFDSGKLTLSARHFRSRSVEPAFFMNLEYGEESICYHSASLTEYLSTKGELHGCASTHLILGAHGPNPKQKSDLSAVTQESILLGCEAHLDFYQFAQERRYITSSVYEYCLSE